MKESGTAVETRARRICCALGLALSLAGLALGGQWDVRVQRASMRKEIAQAHADFARQVPPEAYVRAPDGTTQLNHSHPEVVRLEAEWRARMDQVHAAHNVGDNRWETLQQACQEAGVSDGIANTGSRPQRIESDIDVTETQAGAGAKLADNLRKQHNLEVKEFPDCYVVPRHDGIIWKKPPNLKVGTPQYRAWVRRMANTPDTFVATGAMNATSQGKLGKLGMPTTEGKLGHLDPEGGSLGNAMKASNAGISRNPATELDQIDGHTIAKSVTKAAEWTGTEHHDPEFFRKARMLGKGHADWDKAGVCDPTDLPHVRAQKIRQYLQQAQVNLERAAAAGRGMSQELLRMREDLVRSFERQGLHADAQRVRETIAEVQITNEETMAVLAQRDPQTAGRMAGMKVQRNANGTITDLATGETMTPSQFRQRVTAPSRAGTVSTVRKTTAPPKGAPPPKGTPPPKAGTPTPDAPPEIRPSLKVASYLLLAYGIYHGVSTAVQRAADEVGPDDEWFWGRLKLYGKSAGYSVYYSLGIAAVVQIGEGAQEESLRQFNKDLEDGKDPSAAWATARGAVWGFGGVVKAIIVDPLWQGGVAVWEGCGVITDSLEARRLAQGATQAVEATRKARVEFSRLQEELGAARVVFRPISLESLTVGKVYNCQATITGLPAWVRRVRGNWSFDDEDAPHAGDVVQVSGGSARFTILHTFAADGTCPAEFRFCDAERPQVGTVLIPTSFTVAGPSIALDATWSVCDVGVASPFSASVSHGPAKPAFEWEFESGGQPVRTSVPYCTHTFAKAGIYPVRVRLLDSATGKELARDSGQADVRVPRKLRWVRFWWNTAKTILREEFQVYDNQVGRFSTPVKHGTYRSWYKEGQPEFQGEYLEGNKHGRWTEWQRPGGERQTHSSPVGTGDYRGGSRIGQWCWKWFFPGGAVSHEKNVLYFAVGDTGPRGPIVHSDGSQRAPLNGRELRYVVADGYRILVFEGSYLMGHPDGLHVEYFGRGPLAGSVFSETRYAAGQMDGPSRVYEERAGRRHLRWLNEYKAGKRTEATFYDPDGKVRIRSTYTYGPDGKLTGETVYGPDGKVIHQK